MPLDNFQKEIITVISACRDPDSPFAGGAVIQQHGIRLSDDLDIFAAGELDELMETDKSALEAEGYFVELRESFSGFRECTVSKPNIGTTILQWTHGLTSEFFAPAPDPLFGWRLHFADLAINKALAAGSRMRKRDFVDLWMLDQHVMPLWRLAGAAPGKDPIFSPLSLIEAISRNWHFARSQTQERVDLTISVSIEEFGPALLESIHMARVTLHRMRPEVSGRLQVDESGRPVVNRELVDGGRWITPRPGGALPSFDGIDSEMIAGLVAEYGPEGSNLTGSRPEP